MIARHRISLSVAQKKSQPLLIEGRFQKESGLFQVMVSKHDFQKIHLNDKENLLPTGNQADRLFIQVVKTKEQLIKYITDANDLDEGLYWLTEALIAAIEEKVKGYSADIRDKPVKSKNQFFCPNF